MPPVFMNAKYEQAVSLIGDHTPLRRDCGEVCGKACCGTDDDGQGGVCLLPCEAESLEGREWAEIAAGKGLPLLMCSGPCERAARPFMCRIFPLAPYRNKYGEWDVRMDARARAVCPLAGGGMPALNSAFVSSVRQAVSRLAEWDEGNAFLEKMQEEEDLFRADRKEILSSVRGAGRRGQS